MLRPRAGLPRREPDDLVTTRRADAGARRRGDPRRGAAVHPAVPRARSSSSSTAARRSRAPRTRRARSRRSPRTSPSLRSVGLAPVVVHGGGPQIAELLGTARALERVRRRAPRDRRTRPSTSPAWCSSARSTASSSRPINVHGPLAVGRLGLRREPACAWSCATRALGFVGDVDSVDPTLLHGLLAQGLVPVVATMGSDAARPGVQRQRGHWSPARSPRRCTPRSWSCSPTSTASAATARDPVDACRPAGLPTSSRRWSRPAPRQAAWRRRPRPASPRCAPGVGAAHLLDGRVAHAVLLELFTDGGVGTMVTL